jgi:hypothetical protein
MSALPPKADKQQTSRVCRLCAISRHYAVQQICSLLDHLVGVDE